MTHAVDGGHSVNRSRSTGHRGGGASGAVPPAGLDIARPDRARLVYRSVVLLLRMLLRMLLLWIASLQRRERERAPAVVTPDPPAPLSRPLPPFLPRSVCLPPHVPAGYTGVLVPPPRLLPSTSRGCSSSSSRLAAAEAGGRAGA